MDSNRSDRINSMLRLQRRIAAVYDAHMAEAAARTGLTKPEADVLLFLANNPSRSTARDVAKFRGFSKTYVSRAVERLAGRGFLRIEPHPTDGRIQLLHITEAASVPARRLQYTQLDLFDHLFADVSPEACAILDQIFQQLEENLDWL